MNFFSALFDSIVDFIVDLTEFKPWREQGRKNQLKTFALVCFITLIGFLFYLWMD